MNDRFCVIVTYGTRPNQVYASGCYAHEADRLRDLAVSLGYHDAKVWREDDFHKTQEAYRRGKAHQNSADRQAREVHDLRPQPQSPVAQYAT